MPGRRAAAGLAAAALLLVGGGCGSGAGGSIAVAGGGTAPHGAMTIAVPAPPHRVDPLGATGPIDRLVARQLFEPLVERLVGPYGDVHRRPGLGLSVRPGEGGTLWRIKLRSGVRFQDGTPLDASAVVANAERWRATAAGRALLPGLVAADAPRPDLVRLILDRPVPRMRRLLASPRLGIVSPRELSARAGSGTRLVRTTGAGTGPFELRGAAGPSVVLARNTGWWGTPRGLGPALDQVALRVAPSSFERLRLLHRGDVEAAWALPNGLAAGLRGDPLLTRVPGPGGRWTGLERSVRGIGSARTPPPLSSVWLTRIGAGS